MRRDELRGALLAAAPPTRASPALRFSVADHVPAGRPRPRRRPAPPRARPGPTRALGARAAEGVADPAAARSGGPGRRGVGGAPKRRPPDR